MARSLGSSVASEDVGWTPEFIKQVNSQIPNLMTYTPEDEVTDSAPTPIVASQSGQIRQTPQMPQIPAKPIQPQSLVNYLQPSGSTINTSNQKKLAFQQALANTPNPPILKNLNQQVDTLNQKVLNLETNLNNLNLKDKLQNFQQHTQNQLDSISAQCFKWPKK